MTNATKTVANNHAEQAWLEFIVRGPVDVVRYRTTPDTRTVQFWSDHQVPGLARRGWNTTKSETVAMRARAALKDARRAA